MGRTAHNGQPLGFAIVGCGFISTQHVAAIRATEGCALRMVCDVRPERAQALASRFDAEWTADFYELLDRDDIQVIDICTLPVSHADLAVRAASAGKHVLVEKPIAPGVADAGRMIDAAREAGVKLAVIHQLRFSSINRRMAELLQGGAIGRPFFADASYRTYRPQTYFDQNERGTGKLDGGGAFITHAIHDIDTMLMMMGPVRTVTARTATLGHEMAVEDAGAATFEFCSGAMGILSTGTCMIRHHDRTLEIHGTGGTLFHDEKMLEIYTGRGRAIAYEEIGLDPPGSLHQIQIQDLVDAIRDDREPVVSGHVARRPVAVVEAIYESNRLGRTVVVQENG